MRRLLTLIPVLALLLTVTVQAEERPKVVVEDLQVSGIVLGADGKPAAGVSVSDSWKYDTTWQASGGTKTDADGKFTITVGSIPEQPARSCRIIAANETHAAIIFAKLDDLKSEIKLTLTPLVNVTAALKPTEGFPLTDGSYFSIYWDSPSFYMGYAAFKDGKVSIALPAGTYRYMFRAGRAYRYSRGSFEAKGEATDLGAIDLVVNPIALHYGKPAPAINISYVRNLPEDLEDKGAQVTLADFKGRWVMVEFWGFW